MLRVSADVIVRGTSVVDLAELLQAVLDCLPEGVACADQEGRIRFWNRAAAAITGHARADVVGTPVPDALRALIVGGLRQWVRAAASDPSPARESLLHIRHRLGHELPVLVKMLALENDFGGRLGDAVVFRPAENLDALPRGDCDTLLENEPGGCEFQDRVELEYADFLECAIPFGVLWITVDQAERLRKTHGGRACECMVDKMERILLHGLRPTEQLGRWGEDEFLVLSHERTPETLAAHAQSLAGLARTTDFRWWGDRVSLTVSIGAAQADAHEPLSDLLDRAQAAMLASFHAGGNRSTLLPRRPVCSPS